MRLLVLEPNFPKVLSWRKMRCQSIYFIISEINHPKVHFGKVSWNVNAFIICERNLRIGRAHRRSWHKLSEIQSMLCSYTCKTKTKLWSLCPKETFGWFVGVNEYSVSTLRLCMLPVVTNAVRVTGCRGLHTFSPFSAYVLPSVCCSSCSIASQTCSFLTSRMDPERKPVRWYKLTINVCSFGVFHQLCRLSPIDAYILLPWNQSWENN